MLLVDIPVYIDSGDKNIIRYRNVESEEWFYMYMDIETIHLLVENYGIISTIQVPTRYRCCDNPTTGKNIILNYCGANIELHCGNNSKFDLSLLDQIH
jgi:hypothetical protein